MESAVSLRVLIYVVSEDMFMDTFSYSFDHFRTVLQDVFLGIWIFLAESAYEDSFMALFAEASFGLRVTIVVACVCLCASVWASITSLSAW